MEKGKATHSRILAWRISTDCTLHGVAKSQTQLSDLAQHSTWLIYNAVLISAVQQSDSVIYNIDILFFQGFPDSSAGKESTCNAGDPGLILGLGRSCWRKDRLPTPVFLGFPCGSAGKDSACNAGDLGSIPGLGRSPGEGKGYPLQYSGLENSMDYLSMRSQSVRHD